MNTHRTESLEKARTGQSTRLSSNALLNSAGSLAYYGAVVIVTPLAIKSLGENAWGIWQIVGVVAAYALLLNLGLSSAISYFVSGAVARDDIESVGESIHTARIYLILMGATIAAFFLIFAPELVSKIIEPEDRDVAIAALLASTLITGLTLPSRLYLAAMSAIQRFDLLAAFRITASIALLVIVYFGFRFEWLDLFGFTIVLTLTPIVPSICSWFAVRRFFPRACFAWRKTEWSHLIEMLTFSINTFLYTTGTIIMYQSMKVIAVFNAGGVIAAGHMGLAVSIAQILSVIFVPLVSVMHPRTRDLASRGLHEQIPGLLRKSLVVVGAIATPIILFIWGATPLVLEAWVGDSLSAESIEQLVRTVRFMMPGQWIFIVFLPCYFALVGLGQHRVFGIGLVVAGIANAIFGWVATIWQPTTESLGIVFSIVMVVLVFSTSLPATLKHFRISFGTALYEAIALPCVLTLPGLVTLSLAPAVGDRFADLAIAGAFFAVGAAPGLLMARRRVNSLR